MTSSATLDNPLVEGLERLPVHPTTLTIFGGTGDLAKRKLLPALYNLAHEGALPERFNLIASSRSDMSDEEYRKIVSESVRQFSRREPDETVLEALLTHVRYVPGSFDDESVYQRLGEALDAYDDEAGQHLNRAFYLSTAPEFFPVIVERLGAAGLDVHPDAEVRCIIEKPFGTTLAEAKELNKTVLGVFEERQIFRIDHYLGKETVQNMMAFRFANGLFEPVWNRNYIDNIQITAAEDIGIGTRAGYYDNAGALRDLVQNHMLQLLCHVAMEPPVDFSADEVRDEKVKVLRAIHAPTEEEVDEIAVRAQYAAGNVGGEQVSGYLDEKGVPEDSNTETYAALRLEIDNWRWAGVPFYLRTGKSPGAQDHRDRGHSAPGPPPRVRAGRVGRGQAQPADPHAAAQRGRVALARRQDPRVADANPPGQHGVPLRDGVPVAVARGLRAADHGRDARRRHALHTQRRGRGAVEHLRPDRRQVGGHTRPAAAVRGGHPWPRRGRPPARRRRRLEGDLTTSDAVWSERDTTPGAIDAALRGLLRERHAESSSYVPARVLNLVVVVDAEWSGEVANRLAKVGRFHPSRTIVCAVEQGRDTIDAVASIAADGDGDGDGVALIRELIVLRCGPRHLKRMDTIVDPLVVTDLSTMVWAPHGHNEAVDALLGLVQVVLLDSVDEPDVREALERSWQLSQEAYVVDLAWLRSTPWRERIAATFDPDKLRADLRMISSVVVHHHPKSLASGLLMLGWLASRLDWKPARLTPAGKALAGSAKGRRQDVQLRLEPVAEQDVPGLAGIEVATASGRSLRLDRGPGGLRAHYRHTRGVEREWTVLGASRGEAGILGEGIRQALLRDPTYRPAVEKARELEA